MTEIEFASVLQTDVLAGLVIANRFRLRVHHQDTSDAGSDPSRRFLFDFGRAVAGRHNLGDELWDDRQILGVVREFA